MISSSNLTTTVGITISNLFLHLFGIRIGWFYRLKHLILSPSLVPSFNSNTLTSSNFISVLIVLDSGTARRYSSLRIIKMPCLLIKLGSGFYIGIQSKFLTYWILIEEDHQLQSYLHLFLLQSLKCQYLDSCRFYICHSWKQTPIWRQNSLKWRICFLDRICLKLNRHLLRMLYSWRWWSVLSGAWSLITIVIISILSVQ